MKYTVLFSPIDFDCCLVEISPKGSRRNVLFENVSSLVNYCKDCSIPVTLADCKTSADFSVV